jgi:hypothetical protein
LDQHQIYRHYIRDGFFVKQKVALLTAFLPSLSQAVENAMVTAAIIFDFLMISPKKGVISGRKSYEVRAVSKVVLEFGVTDYVVVF